MNQKLSIPFSELSFSFSRSSGAGGQNINKVNSKVTLSWKIGDTTAIPEDVLRRFREKFHQYITGNDEVQLTCQEHRSQKANIEECVSKLHEMINSVRRPPKLRKKTRPKRSAVLKRLTSKRKDSEKKQLRRRDY